MSTKREHRGTDPLDHLRISAGEGNVVAASVAREAHAWATARIAELERRLAAVEGKEER